MDLELTHFFTFFRSLGGVQTVLRHHHSTDSRWGLRSKFVVFFEPDAPPIPQVSGLGLSWSTTISSARRSFKVKTSLSRTGVAVYINFWGMCFFADLDNADRRIAVLHTHYPELEAHLQLHRGLLDGIFCVTESLMKVVPEALPELNEDRVALLPVPVTFREMNVQKPPLPGRPLVIGICGRLAKEQKRVDQIPALVHCLEDGGIPFRLDIVGEGPRRAWLGRKFAGHSHVRIYGPLAGDEYWNVLAQWDFILFLSDYEGLPIAMLEAMSLGALPLFPAIGSGGDAYATKVRPDLLYRRNDFPNLVAILKNLLRVPQNQIHQLRERARAATAPHSGDAYNTNFSLFTRKIAELPRISKASFPPRPFFWTDYCPFGLLRRTCAGGFFRRSDDRRMNLENYSSSAKSCFSPSGRNRVT